MTNSQFEQKNYDPGVNGGCITLRDYFIAHAPAVYQPWFMPEMPAYPEDESEREKWIIEQSKQRYIQWPSAWADAILNFRDEKLKAIDSIPSLDDILLLDIKNLDITVRTRHALYRNGIHYIGDLIQISERDLSHCSYIGNAIMRDIKDAISKLGLSLGMNAEKCRLYKEALNAMHKDNINALVSHK